jgi:hypothetical protein
MRVILSFFGFVDQLPVNSIFFGFHNMDGEVPARTSKRGTANSGCSQIHIKKLSQNPV